MKHREVAAMSELQNLTLWKEVNKTIMHGKHFQMICSKVNNMIKPSQNFQFILGVFMKMIKLLYADFKHLSILNIRARIEYSIKEDVPFCFCCRFWRKGRFTFFSIVLRE